MYTSNERIQFWIDVDHGDLQYRFLVNYYRHEPTEYFEVAAGKRRLLISSNRPVLRKYGNFGTPAYSLLEGAVTKHGLLPKILEALDDFVEEYRF